MKNIKNNFEWYLAIIYDPNFLRGKSIYNITCLLIGLLKIKFVLLSDLEGAGVSSLIRESELPILDINDFLKKVPIVEQFDWGDFFLFDSLPNEWPNFINKSYPEIISKTKTTIRAIDDSYIYLYTPFSAVIELAQKNYTIETIKKNSLDELDFPY